MRNVVLSQVILLICILGFSEKTGNDVFSIFLPQKEISLDEIEPIISGEDEISQDKIGDIDVKKVLLKDDPLIYVDDITAYYKTSHSLILSVSACDKIMSLKEGTLVFICLDRKPIYWAIIWSHILSVAVNGVVIMKPMTLDKENCYLHIDCGYPTEEWFHGKDPRNNPEIIESLKKSGKLFE